MLGIFYIQWNIYMAAQMKVKKKIEIEILLNRLISELYIANKALSSILKEFVSHRIMEWLRLEGTSLWRSLCSNPLLKQGH